MFYHKIKKNILLTILSLLSLTFLYFVFINVYPYTKIKTFEHQVNKIYSDIEKKGDKFVFTGDSLTYWSVNTVSIPADISSKSKLVFLPNGIYLKKEKQEGRTKTLFLYKVKNNYRIENEYNTNTFAPPFTLDKRIAVTEKPTHLPVKIGEETAFFLDDSDYGYQPGEFGLFVCDILSVVTAFFVFIMFIFLLKKEIKKKRNVFLLLLPIYVLNALLVYKICSYHREISFYLFTQKINYNNVLFFLILTACGFLMYVLTIKLFKTDGRKKSSLAIKIAILLFIAVVYGSAMELFASKEMTQQVEIRAKSLANRRNIETEEKFVNKIGELENDEEFSKLISEKKYSQAEDYVEDIYFKEVSDAYHIGTLVFEDRDSMLIQPMDYYVSILAYVENRIDGARRIDSAFCWVEDNPSDNDNTYIYLCKSEEANIFVEFLKKKNSKNMNYTRLLTSSQDKLEGRISYARYHKGKLVYSYGERIFDNNLSSVTKGWSNERNYRTYTLEDNGNVYLVCYTYKLPYNILGAVSLFFLLLIIIAGIEFIINSSKHFINLSPGIRSSILFFLIGSFVVGIVIAGFFSIRSIRSFNNTYNKEVLREKTGSIKIELENFLPSDGNIDVNNLLLSLSNNYLTDINLYDTNFTLVASSQNSVFDLGFLSKKMNPEAKNNLLASHGFFTLKESIGNLSFLASYTPVTDYAGRTMAYVNIPFINQQKLLDDNINTMVNDFINMFLFWINISIIIFILVSDFITKPLQLLRDKLKKVDLEGKNDKILWDKDDEMGELIKSYNLMLEKLEESSYLLRQQERNTSWRELAAQMAHEINNPLTPMKLSIQYLQKIYNEKPQLFEQKFSSIAPSLINQIDAISNIASELNNYSKPSPNKKEKTDIKHCILSAKTIFENSKGISVDFVSAKEEIFVLGDENLFVRIFNNLLKNAYQAIENKEDGRISISLRKESEYCFVEIEDNGCGIKDEDKQKIFTPRFTTKQDGNGIGLTIVKSIIESYDGTISFTSKENEGTCFRVSFPIC